MSEIFHYPTVSIVIPTLNAASVLESCLQSISTQDYPKEKIEIIICDGGSQDSTLEIAKKYNSCILPNPLKTGESGKMVGVKYASSNFIALIDSDNILPDDKWLINMINPLLNHATAVGSEPWSYVWRSADGFITRYCALIGMNDPLVHFLGNYDRINLLTGKWTEVLHKENDYGEHLVCEFDKQGLPTMGANGTVFRTAFLKEHALGDYLFDIDVLAKHIKEHGNVTFIKTKIGIVHTYCESNIIKFARKQRRRAKDFFYHKSCNNRDYEWDSGSNTNNFIYGVAVFCLCCVTVLPLFYQSIRGYIKKPDVAWFFHPLACEITLWEYTWAVLSSFFKKGEVDRRNWRQ